LIKSYWEGQTDGEGDRIVIISFTLLFKESRLITYMNHTQPSYFQTGTQEFKTENVESLKQTANNI
jgi:hypothetical protein